VCRFKFLNGIDKKNVGNRSADYHLAVPLHPWVWNTEGSVGKGTGIPVAKCFL